jgi:hypothetical protein
MSSKEQLYDEGYTVADQGRSGKWPEYVDDRGGKKWRQTWEFLIRELAGRCPGFTREEYDQALEKGFVDSR